MNSPQRILALDPANLTGWAHSSGASGTIALKTDPNEGTGPRLVRLHNHIKAIHHAHGIDLIAAENSAQGSLNFNTVQSHARLAGIIEAMACRIGARVVFYSPTEIRHFAGVGTFRSKHIEKETARELGKAAMIAAAERITGITPRDDNEADALIILEMAKAGYHDRPKAPAAPKPKKRKTPRTGKPRRSKGTTPGLFDTPF